MVAPINRDCAPYGRMEEFSCDAFKNLSQGPMQHLDHNAAKFVRAIVQRDAESRRSELAELAATINDWVAAIEGARRHGVLPILYSWLISNGVPIPADAMEFAQSEFERNTFHCMANTAELLEVLGDFESAGIAAMPFKGVVLSSSAYGDIKARAAGDLDVLIYYRDLQQATAILKQRNYELRTETLDDGSPEAEHYFEFHFERPEDGMVLELRWKLELNQPRYRYDVGMDWVWPKRRTARLAGAEVPNLDAVSALLVLCMHGSKHAWSRLMWIVDVAKLLESEPGLDWKRAEEEAMKVGLERCLGLGVLMAHGVAGAEVPAQVLRRFEGDRSIRKLAKFFERHIVEDPGRIPEGWIPYNFRILGRRDRAAVLLSPAFLRPSARDRATVKLPKALEPLYYLIRPFRMMLDRTGR